MKSNIGSKERGYEPIQKGINGEEYALKETTREEETTTPAVPEEEDDFLAV